MLDPAHLTGFMIHLERAHERVAQMERVQATLPMTTHIIDAVDGLALGEDDVAQAYRPHLYKPFYPFTLSRGEIACFLSHRRVWSRMVEQDIATALIMEDDVEIRSGFRDALALACDFADKDHAYSEGYFVRFPLRCREKGAVLDQKGSLSLLRPTPVGLGTQMYLLNKPAAERLLSATHPFDRPIDVTLQMFWQNHVRPLCVLPSGIGEISATIGGSTIQNKKRGMEKLRHEILRPLYRWRIARYSRHFSDKKF